VSEKDPDARPGRACKSLRDVTNSAPRVDLVRPVSWYQQIVDTSPNPIFVTDRTGQLLLWNQALAHMLGVSSEQEDVFCTTLIAKPEVEEVQALIDQVFAGETMNDVSLTFRVEGQSTRQMQARLYPLRVGDEVQGCIVASTDVTTREAARAELKHLEAFYAQVLQHMPGTLAVLDREGRYLYLNQAAAPDPELRHWLLGKTPVEHFRRRGLRMSVGWERYNRIQEAIAQQRVIEYHEEIPLTSSQVRHVRRVIAPIVADDGGVHFVISHGRDVTDHTLAERALRASRERIALFLRQAPVAIVEWDLDFRVTDWNPAAERIFGYSRDEALGKYAADLIVPRHVQAEVSQVWQSLVQKKGGTRNVNENVRKDGETITCSWYNTPVVNARGEVIEVVSIVQDITERVHMSRALAQSEERFRKLVQNSSDTIIVVDATGRLRYVSPSVEHVFGYFPDDLLEAHTAAYIHPEDRERVYSAFSASLGQPGATHPIELRVRHAGGTWIHVEALATNLLDDASVGGLVINMRDITERKVYERGLVEAKEEAEAMARIKNTIVNNISHEIRTPLTAILGFAEVLREEVPESHREFAKLIHMSGVRLMDTLNSVLDFSRLESGEIDLDLKQSDLNHVVDEAAALYRPQAERAGLTYEVHQHEAPVDLYLDRGAVLRILSNLISNALKFTDEGSIRIEVHVEPDRAGVAVVDTGMGISTSFRPYLFEEFKQESEGLARQHGGSGLGLAITQRLVEALDGSIEVESEEGYGSTFTVWFPYEAGDGPAATTESSGASGAGRGDSA
jgi:PAS domain S-box-containing protein